MKNILNKSMVIVSLVTLMGASLDANFRYGFNDPAVGQPGPKSEQMPYGQQQSMGPDSRTWDMSSQKVGSDSYQTRQQNMPQSGYGKYQSGSMGEQMQDTSRFGYKLNQ